MPAAPKLPPVLLLTRPRAQSERFAAEVRAACPPHETRIAPLSAIAPLPFDKTAFGGIRGLVLTSANAIPMLADVTGIDGLPAFCVGPGTTRAARAAGFYAKEAGGDARRLVAWLRRHQPQGPLVHAHGRHLAHDLVADLSADGLDIRGVPVYEAQAQDWPDGFAADMAHRRVVAPLFSPRAAAALARQAGISDLGRLVPVAISPACAAQLPPDLRMRCLVSDTPDAVGVLGAVTTALTQPRCEP